MSVMSEAGRPRGLGRGLSALLGDPFAQDIGRAPPAAAVPRPAPQPLQGGETAPADPELPAPAPSQEGVRILSLAQVQRNPGQPRRHFDEVELNELADSIRQHGVLQPILVRPVPGAAERFEIVAGERRWRASQIAGLETIPAQVREIADGEMLEVAIIENVQRSDLNPIEEALGYQALMETFGRTQADVAERVGKSRPHVANMLRLLQLPAEIRGLVQEGKLSAGHARAILLAPNALELARLAIAQNLSVRDVEKLAQRAKEAGEPKSAGAERPAPEPDADVRSLEQTLSAALGLKVSIARKGEGAGEVRIAYEKLEQLDALCRRLSVAAPGG